MPQFKFTFTTPKSKLPSLFIISAANEASAVAKLKKKYKDAVNIKAAI